MEIKADGYVTQDGRLRIASDQRPVFLEKIARNREKHVTVTVSIEDKRRSIPQNRYYYGVVIPLVQEGIKDTWDEHLTKEETHELLKMHCNWKEVVNQDSGESLKIPVSTADLNTTGFEEYLDRCRHFAFEYLNVSIPLPNEQVDLEL